MMDVNKRIDEELKIPEQLYLSGILNLIEDMIYEMENQMEKEGRHFGIVLSYFNSIRQAYNKINSDISDSDLEIYGRIIFLYKNLIYKEYKKLCKKRLSKADALITILRKLLGIFKDLGQDHPKNKEAETVGKIIEKLWENIRNPKKNADLYNMCETIRTFIKEGKVGKYSYEHFSIEEEEEKKEERKNLLPLDDNGIRLDNSDNEISSIEWTEE